ncbi:small multi-drug export protein [Patescibacteria group bacterium]|nr:small multi-drug export protein [Patescibacteria group bacterium]
MPPELTTFLLGTTPVGEIRAAILWGMTFGNLSSAEALFYGFWGNVLATVLVVLFLPKVAEFARQHFHLLDRILQKIFAKTRKKHSKKFLRFAELSLIILVAIPLPGSGCYTGALVAWLFGVKPKTAIALISLGIFFAGIIVLGLTNGMIAFAKSF